MSRAVLFLCTANSSRAVLAEAYLNHVGKGRFLAHSEGSYPAGQVNPLALELLDQRGRPLTAHRRIEPLLALPLDALDPASLTRLQDIGRSSAA